MSRNMLLNTAALTARKGHRNEAYSQMGKMRYAPPDFRQTAFEQSEEITIRISGELPEDTDDGEAVIIW